MRVFSIKVCYSHKVGEIARERKQGERSARNRLKETPVFKRADKRENQKEQKKAREIAGQSRERGISEAEGRDYFKKTESNAKERSSGMKPGEDTGFSNQKFTYTETGRTLRDTIVFFSVLREMCVCP